jgi:Recombinase
VTPVTPSRVTHASVAPWLLTGASLALAGVGITMNGWFARSLGSSDIAGWLFLAIGLATDATALALSDLQLTFESYQNAADSAKTSFRVRSGHNDAAREMLICNAAPYGDDDVLGKPGVKAPNKSEVEIVNRICRETAARMSPRNIAFGLTRDGVPSPNGGAWTFQTINKILQNQLYVGVYVRDKVRKIRNPNTGKRVPRPVAPEDGSRLKCHTCAS